MKKVIEIAGSSTEAECKELVSVTVGYRALLRKPDRKVIDILRLYRLLIIILSICLVLLAAEYMWEVTRTAVGGACIPISAFTLLLLCSFSTLLLFLPGCFLLGLLLGFALFLAFLAFFLFLLQL